MEHELIPMTAALGMGVLPWSPLGGGVLTGKYTRADGKDSREAAVAATRKGAMASSVRSTIARLDTASAPEPIFPQRFVERPLVQQLIFGGSNVARRT